MPYVTRDESGNINGLYASPQDFTNEYLPDDDPEVVAFLEKQKAPPPPTPTQQILFDHENRILAQEGLPPLTMDEFSKKMSV